MKLLKGESRNLTMATVIALIASMIAPLRAQEPCSRIELISPVEAAETLFGAVVAYGHGTVVVGGRGFVAAYSPYDGERLWVANGYEDSFGVVGIAVSPSTVFVAVPDYEPPTPTGTWADGRIYMFNRLTGAAQGAIEKPTVYTDYQNGGAVTTLDHPDDWGGFGHNIAVDPVTGHLYSAMLGSVESGGKGGSNIEGIVHRFDGSGWEFGWRNPHAHGEGLGAYKGYRLDAYGGLCAILGESTFIVVESLAPGVEPVLHASVSHLPYPISPLTNTIDMGPGRVTVANRETGTMVAGVPEPPYGGSTVFSLLVPGGTGHDISFIDCPLAQFPDSFEGTSVVGGGPATRHGQFSTFGTESHLPTATLSVGDETTTGWLGSPGMIRLTSTDDAVVGWPQATIAKESGTEFERAGRAFLTPLYDVEFERADGLYTLDDSIEPPVLIAQPDPIKGGRAFIDTHTSGAFNSSPDAQVVELEVAIIGALNQASAPNYSVRWEVYDPDDPAGDPLLDPNDAATHAASGGDNTGHPHEGHTDAEQSGWFAEALHGAPLDVTSGPVPTAPGIYPEEAYGPQREILLEKARTEIYWDAPTSSYRSSVRLHLSDDGGDNYLVRAVLVRHAGQPSERDVYIACMDTITAWRHRTLFEYRTTKNNILYGGYGGGGPIPHGGGWTPERLGTAFAGGEPGAAIDPDRCAYVHFEHVYESVSLEPPMRFFERCDPDTGAPIVSSAAVHALFESAGRQTGTEFREVAGNIGLCLVPEIVPRHMCNGERPRGITFPWHALVAGNDRQIIRGNRLLVSAGLHEIGHLLISDGNDGEYCGDVCFHDDHTPGEDCAFKQGYPDLTVCTKHILKIRRNCVRGYGPLSGHDLSTAQYDSDE